MGLMLSDHRKLVVENAQLGKAWVIIGYFRLNCEAKDFKTMTSHGDFFTQDSTDGANQYSL